MKIYTRTGDQGTTGLFGGERVSKDHERVEAYGTVDELNAALGVVVAALPAEAAELGTELRQVQSDLICASSWLATSEEAANTDSLAIVAPERAQALEAAMDQMDAQLPPLAGFILPGGDPAAAWAHVARTVCRRAERRLVRVLGEPSEAPTKADEQLRATLVYLNRLSDFLFVSARYINHVVGLSQAMPTRDGCGAED